MKNKLITYLAAAYYEQRPLLLSTFNNTRDTLETKEPIGDIFRSPIVAQSTILLPHISMFIAELRYLIETPFPMV
jgi:hypothetical protein